MYTVNTPIQYALAEYLEKYSTLSQLSDFFQGKRDVFAEMLKGTGFKLLPANGTYFQCVDYSNISQERDTVFAEQLTKQYGVASIPISVFYHDRIDNHVLRFCFAKNNKILEKAAKKLKKVQ